MTTNGQTFKILKRTPNTAPCLVALDTETKKQPKKPVKSLEEREAAYAEARKRILGASPPPSPTPISINCSSTSEESPNPDSCSTLTSESVSTIETKSSASSSINGTSIIRLSSLTSNTFPTSSTVPLIAKQTSPITSNNQSEEKNDKSISNPRKSYSSQTVNQPPLIRPPFSQPPPPIDRNQWNQQAGLNFEQTLPLHIIQQLQYHQQIQQLQQFQQQQQQKLFQNQQSLQFPVKNTANNSNQLNKGNKKKNSQNKKQNHNIPQQSNNYNINNLASNFSSLSVQQPPPPLQHRQLTPNSYYQPQFFPQPPLPINSPPRQYSPCDIPPLTNEFTPRGPFTANNLPFHNLANSTESIDPTFFNNQNPSGLPYFNQTLGMSLINNNNINDVSNFNMPNSGVNPPNRCVFLNEPKINSFNHKNNYKNYR